MLSSIPRDSESPAVIVAGNLKTSQLLVSDSFLVQRSRSLTRNSLPKIHEIEDNYEICNKFNSSRIQNK